MCESVRMECREAVEMTAARWANRFETVKALLVTGRLGLSLAGILTGLQRTRRGRYRCSVWWFGAINGRALDTSRADGVATWCTSSRGGDYHTRSRLRLGQCCAIRSIGEVPAFCARVT